jgi:hypothetical protein
MRNAVHPKKCHLVQQSLKQTVGTTVCLTERSVYFTLSSRPLLTFSLDDQTVRTDGTFHAAYRRLEERMNSLAHTEADVFLPNPEPEGPVHYVFICMEPSLGRWARSADEARSKVEAGFRNFLYSIEDYIFHFSIRRYLCKSTERYHITDLSKGAMLVQRAGPAREDRYDRWYPLLEDEINLVATPNACIVAVGKIVSRYLKRKAWKTLHWCNSPPGQAARARRRSWVTKTSFRRSAIQSPWKI